MKSDSNKRPLLSNTSLEEDLETLIKQRYPFYVEADLQIIVDEETPEEVALAVLNKLPSIISN